MEDTWKTFTDTFNNRELAIGIWMSLGFVVCMMHSKIRPSLWGVFASLLNRKLLVLFGVFALNVAALCIIYQAFGLWTREQLPATVLWYFLSGCALLARALSAKEDEGYFRKLIRDSIGVALLFEFIVVAYSFSLLTELVLFPLLFLLGGTLVIAETDEKYAQVKTLLQWCLTLFLLAFLWQSMSGIWSNWDAFYTTTTARNFILPVLLTIGSIPCFYAWYCYSHIEQARIQIDFKSFQSDELKQYARKRFLLIFMARPWLLRRAIRQFHSMPARENDDVDQIILDIYKYEREAENPPDVNPRDGWSPYLAREFLTEFGLRTNDYHSGFEGEWWASSDYADLDDYILPNNAAFYLEGTEDAVTKLKLTGKFRDEFDSTEAIAQLRVIAVGLFEKAGLDEPSDIQELIPSSEPFRVRSQQHDTQIDAWLERYPSGTGFEIFLTLAR
ncbi:MAG: hypothetical protein P1U83_13445 [Roseovarius sp.]|nr:hypothetical protein [Roseovarius sp.]